MLKQRARRGPPHVVPKSFLGDARGAVAIEYALIGATVMLAIAGPVFTLAGQHVADRFASIASAFTN
jgi:Flp pilus assembly pilin Flp